MSDATQRVLLKVNRFKQRGNECAIASAAALANYFDPSIKYSSLRKQVPERIRRNGLFTSCQAALLNSVGFDKITIVTCDLKLVDFSWANLDKENIIKKLSLMKSYYNQYRHRDPEAFHATMDLLKWLSDERYDNNLKIDHDFPKYIKRSLDIGIPVSACINATALFKLKKCPVRYDGYQQSDIKGLEIEHAVVIRGYDSKGIYIVDSDHGFKEKQLTKYESGYYKISWQKYLTSAPTGDLILVRG